MDDAAICRYNTDPSVCFQDDTHKYASSMTCIIGRSANLVLASHEQRRTSISDFNAPRILRFPLIKVVGRAMTVSRDHFTGAPVRASSASAL